ncbi:MAG: 3-hydroxyacyl-ACP dehydratase FabZ [Fimbriimonadales bacterium]|nr:3-hydroxyacyl-ACP dehydratase FabZ [Fimbriimonadales bacterium]
MAEISLDIEQIQQIIPHRYPFLLVDRIVELEPGKRAVGLKNVTINESFFQGHFPVKAIMPGVLILEAMAQVGAVMVLLLPEMRHRGALLGGIDNARFRRPVVPGDTLRMEVEMLWMRREVGRVKATARVNGELAAEAEITFALPEPQRFLSPPPETLLQNLLNNT